jgi:uncharacterized cupin superfamily protein
MKLQRSTDLKHRQLKSSKTGEEYSLSSVISDAFASDGIFLSHEIIRPNSKSSGAHFHTETDEIIYILEGSITAVEDNEQVELSAGDSILFERQSGKYHFLQNNSSSDCVALVIRRKITTEDVVFATKATTTVLSS